MLQVQAMYIGNKNCYRNNIKVLVFMLPACKPYKPVFTRSFKKKKKKTKKKKDLAGTWL